MARKIFSQDEIAAVANEWDQAFAIYSEAADKLAVEVELTGVEFLPGKFIPRDDQPELMRGFDAIAEAPECNPLVGRHASTNMTRTRRQIADLNRITKVINTALRKHVTAGGIVTVEPAATASPEAGTGMIYLPQITKLSIIHNEPISLVTINAARHWAENDIRDAMGAYSVQVYAHTDKHIEIHIRY